MGKQTTEIDHHRGNARGRGPLSQFSSAKKVEASFTDEHRRDTSFSCLRLAGKETLAFLLFPCIPSVVVYLCGWVFPSFAP
jgi:hypothetical protein